MKIAQVEYLQIGKIASLSGLSVKTIPYYADLDLLAPHLQRSQSDYRLLLTLMFSMSRI